MESCPPWLRFREGGNELSLTGSFSTTTSSFSLTSFLFLLIWRVRYGEGERGRWMRGIKAVDEGEDRLERRSGERLAVLLTYIFGLRTNKSGKKNSFSFLLTFFPFPFAPISHPYHHCLPWYPFFSSYWVPDIWPQLLLRLQPGLRHEPRGILQLWAPVLGHVPDEERPNRQRTLW